MITASHNPYRWNGIKFKASYGSSALPSIVAQIETELATVLRDGVPALPPRTDLIHSLDLLRALSGHARRAGGLGKSARREIALRGRSHARRGARAAARTDAPPRRRLRRNSRHSRSAFRRRQSRTHRAARCGAARRRARRRITMPALPPMAMATASAPWTAMARSSRRTRSSRSCSGISPARASSPAIWPKLFPPPRLLDKIAAQFGRQVYEVPVGFKYICELMLERDILLGGEESRRHRHQALLARARRDRHRAAAGGSDGLASQIARRTRRATARGIWRTPLWPRGPGTARRDRRNAPSHIFRAATYSSSWIGPSSAAKISTASRSIWAKSAG